MANFAKLYDGKQEERSLKSQQNYDRKTIMLTKAGKTFNVYDYIQENRTDTEIIPTLEKYGCIDVMVRPAQEIYGEFQEGMNLQTVYEQEIALQELFNNLPLNERKVFNMNYYDFRENGLKYYENKMKKEIEAMTENTMITPKTEPKTEEGGK